MSSLSGAAASSRASTGTTRFARRRGAPDRTPGMAREPAGSGRIRAKGRAKEGFQQALPPGPNTAETKEPPQVQGLL
jgi:hypothetical protein